MINLAKNETGLVDEVCLRRELSHSAKPESSTHKTVNCTGDKIIRLSLTSPSNRTQSKADQRVEASVRYMMQHLNQPLKVSTLSGLAGLSDSSFFALFKSVTGRSPLDFFIRARMRWAGELLVGTTLQIKEVADMLGYDDQFYFSRIFKSVHGVPPREYRARKDRDGRRTLAVREHGGVGLPDGLPSTQPPPSAGDKAGIRERIMIDGLPPARPGAKLVSTPARGTAMQQI